jgi:hypothetical protein
MRITTGQYIMDIRMFDLGSDFTSDKMHGYLYTREQAERLKQAGVGDYNEEVFWPIRKEPESGLRRFVRRWFGKAG